MATPLTDLLDTRRLTEIVDVGANPIDGDPPYQPLLAAGICRVTGFEPQARALAELQKKQSRNERYLPDAIGDGNRHTLHLCRAPGMTGLFEPDPAALSLFEPFRQWGEVVQRTSLETRKLDDCAEIDHLDFLKIDIQGGELDVFRNGTAKLSKAVAIQTEVSFIALYRNQPVFGEVDMELRRQGFVPHCFAAVKRWPIAPCVIANDPLRPLNQLLEADIVYVRDFSDPRSMDAEQLKHLAIIAHYCYRSFDLALRCISYLEHQRALEAGAQQRYLQLLSRAT